MMKYMTRPMHYIPAGVQWYSHLSEASIWKEYADLCDWAYENGLGTYFDGYEIQKRQNDNNSTSIIVYSIGDTRDNIMTITGDMVEVPFRGKSDASEEVACLTEKIAAYKNTYENYFE